jgi:hypothetical protein
MASHDHIRTTRLASVEVALFTSNLPLKGTVAAKFRSKVAADLACILDLDVLIVSWSYPAGPSGEQGQYTPDFLVEHIDGQRWLVDAPDRNGARAVFDPAVAQTLGCAGYRMASRAEIYDGFRLRNARDLLRYARHIVPLGDRMRLLAALDEHGSLSFAECLQTIRESRAVPTVAAMILQGFLEVELDEALLGPETMVRRIRG